MREITFVSNHALADYQKRIEDCIDKNGNPASMEVMGENSTAHRLRRYAADLPHAVTDNKDTYILVIVATDDPIELSGHLHTLINAANIFIIAPITARYYKNTPLFLIGIPKGGTHLLFELANTLGYTARRTTPEKPKGGEWYYVEYDNAHTRARHFFIESLYTSCFGMRDHPFAYTPTIFMYRHPADIVVSEANYYHKKGRTPFYGYFAHNDFCQRLSKLIDDPYLLGSIRDRVADFIPWLDFGNVVPVSFEELIGSKGGASDELREHAVWSMQLKLHVPGRADELATKLDQSGSDTFFKGQCGVYGDQFQEQHWQAFRRLNPDFFQIFGYSLGKEESFYSSRIKEFRERILHVDQPEEWPTYIENNQFLNHRILKHNNLYYGAPFGTAVADLERLSTDDDPVVKGRYVDEVKAKILKKYLAD